MPESPAAADKKEAQDSREGTAEQAQKKDNKDAKATMINFKNRVLDLLLIYVKQQHANPRLVGR